MEAILSTFDFSFVNAKYVDDIKNTCMMFQDFKVNIDDPPLTVIGSKFDYIVLPIKNGINVQAVKKGEYEIFYFGIMITRNFVGDMEILPYMNGHRD